MKKTMKNSKFLLAALVVAGVATSPAWGYATYVENGITNRDNSPGFVVDESSRNNAQQNAMFNCFDNGKAGTAQCASSNAEDIVNFDNKCIGVYIKGQIRHIALGDTREKARENAEKKCQTEGVGSLPCVQDTVASERVDICDATCFGEQVSVNDENNVAGCRDPGATADIIEINADCMGRDSNRPIESGGGCRAPRNSAECVIIYPNRPIYNAEESTNCRPARNKFECTSHHQTAFPIFKEGGSCNAPANNEECVDVYHGNREDSNADFFPIHDDTLTLSATQKNQCRVVRTPEECSIIKIDPVRLFGNDNTTGVYDPDALPTRCRDLVADDCYEMNMVFQGRASNGVHEVRAPRCVSPGADTDCQQISDGLNLAVPLPAYSDITRTCVATPTGDNPSDIAIACAATFVSRQIYDPSASNNCRQPQNENECATHRGGTNAEDGISSIPTLDLSFGNGMRCRAFTPEECQPGTVFKDGNCVTPERCAAVANEEIINNQCVCMGGSERILHRCLAFCQIADGKIAHGSDPYQCQCAPNFVPQGEHGIDCVCPATHNTNTFGECNPNTANDNNCASTEIFYPAKDGIGGICIPENELSSNPAECRNFDPALPIYDPNVPLHCKAASENMDCRNAHPTHAPYYNTDAPGECKPAETHQQCADVNVQTPILNNEVCEAATNIQQCRNAYPVLSYQNCRDTEDHEHCAAEHSVRPFVISGECRLPIRNFECAQIHTGFFDNSQARQARPIYDPRDVLNCRELRDNNDCMMLQPVRPVLKDGECVAAAVCDAADGKVINNDDQSVCQCATNYEEDNGDCTCPANYTVTNDGNYNCQMNDQATCTAMEPPRILKGGSCMIPENHTDCMNINPGRPRYDLHEPDGTRCREYAQSDCPAAQVLNATGTDCEPADSHTDCETANMALPVFTTTGCVAEAICDVSDGKEIDAPSARHLCRCVDNYIGTGSPPTICTCPATHLLTETHECNPLSSEDCLTMEPPLVLKAGRGCVAPEDRFDCENINRDFPIFENNECVAADIVCEGDERQVTNGCEDCAAEHVQNPTEPTAACVACDNDAEIINKACVCNNGYAGDGISSCVLCGNTQRVNGNVCTACGEGEIQDSNNADACVAAANDTECQTAYPYNFDGANAKPRPIHVGGSCIEVRNIVDCERVNPARPIYNVVANAMSDCEPVDSPSDCAAVDDAVPSGTGLRGFDGAACQQITKAYCDAIGKIFNGDDRCRDPADNNDCRNTIPTRPIEQSGVCNMATSNTDCSGAFTTTFPYLDESGDGSCRPANGNPECLNTNDGRTPLLSGGVCVAGANHDECRMANPQKPILNDMGNSDTTDDECRGADNNNDCRMAYGNDPLYFYRASDGSCRAASAANCQANGDILRNGACVASSECEVMSGGERIVGVNGGNECVCAVGFAGSAGSVSNPCSCPVAMPYHDTVADPDTCRLPSDDAGKGDEECAALDSDMPEFDNNEADKCRAREQDDCATGEILLSGSCEEIMTPQHCMTLHLDAMPIFDGGQADRCRPRIQDDCTGTAKPILRGLVCEVATDRADCYTTFGDAMPRFVADGTCATAGNDEQCQAAYPYNFNGANAKPRPIHDETCIEVRNIVDCHSVDSTRPIHNVVANAMSDCEPVGDDSDCAAVDDAVQSITNRRAFDDNAACRAVTQADDCDEMGKIYNGTDRCRDPSDSNECRNTIPTRPIEQSGVCDMATSNADCSGAFPTTFPYRNESGDGSCRAAVSSGECAAVNYISNTTLSKTPLLSGGVCVAGDTNQACRAANSRTPILDENGAGRDDDECRMAANNLDCSTAYSSAPYRASDGSCRGASADSCRDNSQVLRGDACVASSECMTSVSEEVVDDECVCRSGFSVGSAGGNPGCTCPLIHDDSTEPNTCRLPSDDADKGDEECAEVYGNEMPIYDGGEQDRCRAYRQSDCTPMMQVVNANDTGCEDPDSHQDCEDINSNLPVHKGGSCFAVAECAASDGEEINPGDRSECQCAANYTGNPGSCECPSLTHTVNNNNQCMPNTVVECLASDGEEVNPENTGECRCLVNYAGIPPNCVVRTADDCAQTEFFVATEDGVGGICRDRVADDCAQTEFFVAAEDGVGGICRDRTEQDCDAATETFVAAEGGGGICEVIPTDNTCDAAAGKIPDAEDENACMCAANYIEEGENCICPTATHIQRANNACELPQNSNECAALNPALPIFNDNNDACVVFVASPILPDNGDANSNINGDGTETSPLRITEDVVADFTLPIEVDGGSGNFEYRKQPEGSSPQLTVEPTSGVVSFIPDVVDIGVYTIIIRVLDNGESGGGSAGVGVANQNVLAAAGDTTLLTIYITVAAVVVGPPSGVTIVTPRDKVKIETNKVVGIAAGAVVAVAYWYFSNINNKADASVSWKPSYAFRNDDGNMYYSVGSRWNAAADNWRFYWQTSATGGNGAREFTYGSGLKYDDGTFAAALDSHSDSDMTDLDLALSATKTAGAWRLDGGYDLDMQISATETDTQNEFNIGALYTWEQWSIGGLYTPDRWNLASRYTVANQWNVAARYSLNNWNIAAQYTLDKWILSANATMNGDTATGRIIYSYRFR